MPRTDDRGTVANAVTEPRSSRGSGAGGEGVTLRLLWPQWQGAGTSSVRERQVRRIVGDIDADVDVVGVTVAEFIPRQVMHLRQLLTSFPLLQGLALGGDHLVVR
jgi:hypothetical protein